MALNNLTENTTTTDWNNVTEKRMEDYIEYQISWKIFQIYVPFCTLVGITGNVMSFLVLVFSSLRYTSTCIYMATVACLDTTILSVVLVYHIARYPDTRVFHTWTCSVITFFFYFAIHFDTLILLAMTFERYVVVRFPLKALSITRKKTLMIIAGIGVFSLAINFHTFFTRKMDVVNGVERCAYDSDADRFFVTKIYPWIDSTLYCFIPMSSLFVLNIMIIYHVKKSANTQKKLTEGRTNTSHAAAKVNSGGTGGMGENRKQRQVTIMLVFVSVAFLLLAGPIAILIIVQRYQWIATTPHERAINWLAHSFADNLMYTNHAINFILYLLSGQRFRRELKRLICVHKKPTGTPTTLNQATSHSELTGEAQSTVSEITGTSAIVLQDKY